MIAGLIIGLVAQRTQSLPIGIVVGLLVGAGLAALITIGGPYFWEIVLPGAIVGLIVGYATFTYASARRCPSDHADRRAAAIADRGGSQPATASRIAVSVRRPGKSPSGDRPA